MCCDHHCKGKHPFPFSLVSNPSVPESFFTTRTADYRPASLPFSLLVLPTPPFTDPPSRFNELALPPRLLPLRLGHPVSTPASLSYTKENISAAGMKMKQLKKSKRRFRFGDSVFQSFKDPKWVRPTYLSKHRLV